LHGNDREKKEEERDEEGREKTSVTKDRPFKEGINQPLTD